MTTKPSDNSHRPLVGTRAPDFATDGYQKGSGEDGIADYRLEDFADGWLLLFFYPADFSPLCHSEINQLSKRVGDLEKLNCRVVGVSTDSVYSHRAWVEGGHIGELDFPLLSDSNHRISRAYRVLDPETGSALRAHVLIDPESRIQFRLVQPPRIQRNIEQIVSVLERLQQARLSAGPEESDGDIGLD